MRNSRGCGCVVLVLGLINLLIVVTLIYGLFSLEGSLAFTLLMLAVFVANVAVCAMTGRDMLRRNRETPDSPTDAEEELTTDDAEGDEGDTKADE
jgi:hypothetical protein